MLNNDSVKKQPTATIDISKVIGSVYIAPICCESLVTYHALRKQGIEILGFCDNDPTMAGKSYDGCSIYSPDAAVEKNPEATFVIANAFYYKQISEQFKKLGAANVLYAGQFMKQDIFIAALDDMDENAAKTLTCFCDPKSEAIRKAELFWQIGLESNIDLVRVYFRVWFYNKPVESFKQWFDKIHGQHDAFTEISIDLGDFSNISVDQMTDMIFYLTKHLKKPTKWIKLHLSYGNTIEQNLQNLEECLLKEGICPIYSQQKHDIEFSFRTSDIPIIIEKEDAYSDVEDMYNCVFTHIDKTAGTSINRMLSSRHSHHKRTLLCKLYDPERFNKYFKFAVVRNPWDWLVSYYFFLHRLGDSHDWNLVDCETTNLKSSMYYHKTFKGYILSLKNSSMPLQSPWICDDDGNILVDYIGRFENLPETVRYIQEKLGLDPTISLPHVNASKHKPYTEYYDEEMIEIVREAAKRDIELFGYEFGKHPGANIIINPRKDFVPVNRNALRIISI